MVPGRLDSVLAARLDGAPAAFARREDVAAGGVVVALVALPLSLGVALTAGAPVASGVISAVVGGMLVAWLSGSPVMVSGPAAGLAAVALDATTQLDSFQAFLVAVVLAGAIQVALGAMRAGGRHAHPGAVLLSLLSLLVLLAWDHPRLEALKTRVPAALVVVPLGVLGNALFAAAAPAFEVPARGLVHLPLPSAGLGVPSYLISPDWSALRDADVYRAAVVVALVASCESLLGLEAAAKLRPYERAAAPCVPSLAAGPPSSPRSRPRWWRFCSPTCSTAC